VRTHSNQIRPPIVLIVDDDEGHAFLIREILEEAGIAREIAHFSDGQAILDYFDRTSPGAHAVPGETYVMLLDVRMPKMSGVEVLARFKSDPMLKKIPVIMLTTTDDARDVERCHHLGCNIYIQKPIDYEKFSDAIKRLGSFMSLLLVPPMSGSS
jgi:CheY-like chemotaxis protein